MNLLLLLLILFISLTNSEYNDEPFNYDNDNDDSDFYVYYEKGKNDSKRNDIFWWITFVIVFFFWGVSLLWITIFIVGKEKWEIFFKLLSGNPSLWCHALWSSVTINGDINFKLR